jgi:hypothetical protein
MFPNCWDKDTRGWYAADVEEELQRLVHLPRKFLFASTQKGAAIAFASGYDAPYMGVIVAGFFVTASNSTRRADCMFIPGRSDPIAITYITHVSRGMHLQLYAFESFGDAELVQQSPPLDMDFTTSGVYIYANNGLAHSVSYARRHYYNRDADEISEPIESAWGCLPVFASGTGQFLGFVDVVDRLIEPLPETFFERTAPSSVIGRDVLRWYTDVGADARRFDGPVSLVDVTRPDSLTGISGSPPVSPSAGIARVKPFELRFSIAMFGVLLFSIAFGL